MSDSPGTKDFLDAYPIGACLNGIASLIASLDLAGMDDQVWIRKAGTTKGVTFPAVIIAPTAGRYNSQEGGATRPDVWYRFGVMIARGGSREDAWTAESAATLGWGDEIFRAFAKTARPFQMPAALQSSGYQVILSDVELGEPTEIQHWREGLDCELLGINVKVRFPSTAP